MSERKSNDEDREKMDCSDGEQYSDGVSPVGEQDMDTDDSGVVTAGKSGGAATPKEPAKPNNSNRPGGSRTPAATSTSGRPSNPETPTRRPGAVNKAGEASSQVKPAKKQGTATTPSGKHGPKHTDTTKGPTKGKEQDTPRRAGLRSEKSDPKELEKQARKAGNPTEGGTGKLEQNGVNGSNESGNKKKKTNTYSPDDHGGSGTRGAYPGYDQGFHQGQGQYNGQDARLYPGPQYEPGIRDQMQEHIFRQAQASKQMVYGVFGNCITMLEEMETRELRKDKKKALPRSDIYVPDQSKFDDKTIKTKLDTQLILLQAQLTSCHDAIRDEVKDELKANTLHWASEREEKNIPEGMTDDYVAKLFGLLDTGKADHPREFDEPPTIDEKGMHKALGAIMQGNQKRAELDKDFKDNPNKKAAGPNMRPTAGIDKGADRIVRVNPEHGHAVDSYRESLL